MALVHYLKSRIRPPTHPLTKPPKILKHSPPFLSFFLSLILSFIPSLLIKVCESESESLYPGMMRNGMGKGGGGKESRRERRRREKRVGGRRREEGEDEKRRGRRRRGLLFLYLNINISSLQIFPSAHPSTQNPTPPHPTLTKTNPYKNTSITKPNPNPKPKPNKTE